MLLQNEKLVVDEFLEKVAAASRKVWPPPDIAFPCLLAVLCILPLTTCCLLLMQELGDQVLSDNSA